MSNKRIITSKTRSSQKFNSLTYRQRDLWHGLIVVADDQGRLPGTPAYVRSQVWPYDDVKLDEVASDLDSLVDSESIVIYEVEGMQYLQIINWWKYQKMQWAGKSDYPPPTNWVDRERYHGPGNEIFTENWDQEGGFSELPSVLDSTLSSELSSEKGTPRENVKVKGNDEVKEDGEESNPDGIYADLSIAFCNKTGIPELTGGPQAWYKSLKNMGDAGVIVQDVEKAIDILRDGDYSIVRLSSIENTAIGEMSKRKGKGPDRDSEEFRRSYVEGKYKDFIEH